MKNFVCLFLILFLSTSVFSQTTAKYPTKSRFYSNRYRSYSIKDGDILLYNFKKDTLAYNLTVIVRSISNAINLSYSISENAAILEKEKSGNIVLPEQTRLLATKYDTLITDSMATLKNEIVFWMSQKNFKELYYIKESQMDMGNGMESFARENTSTIKIKIKGRETLLTLFNMDNQKGKAKSMSVLTDDSNPLIVRMDAGKWTMSLSEIR